MFSIGTVGSTEHKGLGFDCQNGWSVVLHVLPVSGRFPAGAPVSSYSPKALEWIKLAIQKPLHGTNKYPNDLINKAFHYLFLCLFL